VLHRAGGRTLVEQIVRACEPLKGARDGGRRGTRRNRSRQWSAIWGSYRAAAAAKWHRPRHASCEARARPREICGCAPGRRPPRAPETLKELIARHHNGNAAATILSAVLADPAGYGRILRKSETMVSAIVEESQLTDEQREINEINSAIYCFTLEKLWPRWHR